MTDDETKTAITAETPTVTVAEAIEELRQSDSPEAKAAADALVEAAAAPPPDTIEAEIAPGIVARYPASVPPPRPRPQIPIPNPEAPPAPDILAAVAHHAPNVTPPNMPDGSPDSPVWYNGHPRWNFGAAAGGPVVTTLCPSCPRAVGRPPDHLCGGPISVDVLRGPPDKFLVCPGYPKARAVPA